MVLMQNGLTQLVRTTRTDQNWFQWTRAGQNWFQWTRAGQNWFGGRITFRRPSTQVQATRTGEAWSQLVRPGQNWFGGTENDLSQLEQTARTSSSWRQNDLFRQVVQTTRTGQNCRVLEEDPSPTGTSHHDWWLRVTFPNKWYEPTFNWPDWSGGRMNCSELVFRQNDSIS